MAEKEYAIVLAGKSKVGLTSIQRRFCTGQYTQEDVQYLQKDNFHLRDWSCGFGLSRLSLLHIMEICIRSGFDQSDFAEIFMLEICTQKNVVGILLVYDIGNRDSFDHIKEFLPKANRFFEVTRDRHLAAKEKEPVFMLVGNKCDLADDGKRKVSKEEGENLAKKFNMPFKEVSARENINIDPTFTTLAEAITEKRKKEDERRESQQNGGGRGEENVIGNGHDENAEGGGTPPAGNGAGGGGPGNGAGGGGGGPGNGAGGGGGGPGNGGGGGGGGPGNGGGGGGGGPGNGGGGGGRHGNIGEGQEEDQAEKEYKIMLVGESIVGKTAIMKRFCANQFSEEYAPTYVPFTKMKEHFNVNGSPCTVVVLDTPSKDDPVRFFRGFFPYGPKVDAIIMVYDIGNLGSFDRIQDQMRRMKEIFKYFDKKDGVEDWPENPPMFMLVGNKCDLEDDERKVSTEDGKSRAKWFDVPFKEVSARENTNIDSMFITLVEAIIKKKAKEASDKSTKEILETIGTVADFAARVFNVNAGLSFRNSNHTTTENVNVTRRNLQG